MNHRPAIRTLIYVPLFCSALWLSVAVAGSPGKTSHGQVQAQSNAPAQTNARAQANAKANKTVDACSLLTSGEIAAILGEPLQELKPSLQSTGSMTMAHCLFVTRDFAKSASLAVTTPAADDRSARRLRAFWRNQFHSPRQPEEKRPASRQGPEESAFASSRSDNESRSEPDGEPDEAAGKPRAIPALGDEAYWVGSPISGALYVLKGALFLRISVGGIPKESIRIAKSKSIAHAVLPRLRH